MNVTIAALGEHEVEAVCGLAAEIWRHHYPAIIGEAQTEYMLAQRYRPEIVRDEMASGKVWWDVLREDGKLIAFASSFVTPDGELKLDKLYVHPERQRMGLGGRLLAHTCERARQLGCGAVVLAVNKRNASAISAYEKHGFTVREAVVKDIGGGFVMDDYVMVRDPFQ